MADTDYYHRDAASLADETGRIDVDELLILLEQKDSDLRKAAELGKMLLDEKEAAAEAHEGEKEALWRRIQDMARRVMELEQEAAESRDEFSLQQDEHARRLALAGAQRGGGGGINSSRRVSHGGGGDRAEERALRAKNEMLERQLAHMREEAEETQLELAAARKSSPALSARLERGDGSLNGGGFGAAPPRPLSPAGSSFSPSRLPEVVAAVSGGGGGGGVAGTPLTPGNGDKGEEEEEEEENDAEGGESEVWNDELRAADRVHASALRARIEEAGESDDDGDGDGDNDDIDDEQDVAWLLEQNTWLMQELEAKDDFIQALREQMEQLQRGGGHGPGPSSSMQSLRELGGSDDSDDDSDQEGGQRSFLDHLLHGTGGGGSNGQRPVDGHHEPTNPSVPTTVVSRNEGRPRVVTTNDDAPAAPGLRDGCAAAGVGQATAAAPAALEAAAPRGRRSFGGVLAGNAMQDADKTAQNSARSSRRQSMQSAGGVTGIVGYAAAAAEVASATTTAGASSTTRVGAMATVPPLPEAEETTAATTKAKPPTPAPPAATLPTVEAETTKATGRQKAMAKVKAKQQEEEAAAAAAAAAAEPAAQEAVPPLAHMNRAERKSRQAVEKLGLRAVKGVFRMTMRTTNGVVFVVKAPDVFRHPRQETYVVFGSAETDGSGSEVRASRPPRSFVPPPKKAAAVVPASRPDPLAVESDSISAGLDPADVLTLVSQVGCDSQAAIVALRQADGDVINAVLDLTFASSGGGGGGGSASCSW
ncbi:nascent polypeptide associated complex alpha [Ectocarpus siliculosus]|uniref:Nascent polypeptide associated complex alpha n=1 Tax=Ectocarpus siliculosus TaxID=2880 RepID=D7FI48_ECTSI|nr:nascent polypeptide associated complex alpha [Ectocarpus siliculosus]|eukprot:CBJ28674.1 nascent polypeptide associated complex alpha [Ectocarpus siliculosus]